MLAVGVAASWLEKVIDFFIQDFQEPDLESVIVVLAIVPLLFKVSEKGLRYQSGKPGVITRAFESMRFATASGSI